MQLPREYILEKPACLDETKLSRCLDALRTITNFDKLYTDAKRWLKYYLDNDDSVEPPQLHAGFNIFISYFPELELKAIAVDILIHVIDIDPGNMNYDVIKIRLLNALYEAGFFG